MNKFNSFIALFLFFSLTVCAKVETGHLFVHLSDAMGEVKQGKTESAVAYLHLLESEFHAIDTHNSTEGKNVAVALAKVTTTPDNQGLENLSKALLAFEKEQNPVDYQAKREQFAKRVIPVFQKLEQAVLTQDLEAIQQAYKQFNTTWTVNEKVVRETSLGHYGQIETAMTLIRSGTLSEPVNFTEIQRQTALLGTALTDFKNGNTLQPQTIANAPQTLPEGIKLLEQAYQSFQAAAQEKGRSEITLFIQQWAIFEGDVRTRNGQLYTRVESELPLIMAKGLDATNQQQFQRLIEDLKALNTEGHYSFIDAMLILLREGLEALVIIMALVTTVKAANRSSAIGWIYSGAGLGIFASLIGAIALQQLFPAISAGKNREILESAVGILAVLIMLFVGAWLHGKSSIQGWKTFVDQQLGKALATGNLISILLLSFLSVFREGAETILFYAGMLPLISTTDLLLGIASALAILVVIALLMNNFSTKLAVHHLFKLMTWLIYGLGFKILGVSINTLQLTQILPRHIWEQMPNMPLIGFYNSWEGIVAQAAYLLLIPLVVRLFK